MTKLEEAQSKLAEVVAQIEAYAGGDRPPSPPVYLLREERRLRSLVAWYRREDIDRSSTTERTNKP